MLDVLGAAVGFWLCESIYSGVQPFSLFVEELNSSRLFHASPLFWKSAEVFDGLREVLAQESNGPNLLSVPQDVACATASWTEPAAGRLRGKPRKAV